MKSKTETIAAQATPPGRGGIGIIRVSGSETLAIAKAIFGKEIKAGVINFCNFFAEDKKIIDRGLALYFSAPHSFTGEDVLELHGHGGTVIMDLLLQRVLELGARLATPGEFIKRAFLNRKLDLTQVEAVADLINASTQQAAQGAANSLQGEFSKEVNRLVMWIIGLRAQIEAAIDFTEEGDVDQVTTDHTNREVDNILCQIENLRNKARQGALLREGITVVIAGDTNAGKSSLFNCLSGQDAAIVTNIPGTTRDVLHVSIQIDGLLINLLDTAGLRQEPDLIEAEGIRRVWEEAKKANHILFVVDTALGKTRKPKELRDDFLAEISAQIPFTVLYNKIDLTGEKAQTIKEEGVDCIYLSVKEQQGIDLLKQHIKNKAGFNTAENSFSARRRHLDALKEAEKHLQNIRQKQLGYKELELIAEELRGAQNRLGEITGEVTPDDLLEKIFSEFCVGK